MTSSPDQLLRLQIAFALGGISSKLALERLGDYRRRDVTRWGREFSIADLLQVEHDTLLEEHDPVLFSDENLEHVGHAATIVLSIMLYTKGPIPTILITSVSNFVKDPTFDAVCRILQGENPAHIYPLYRVLFMQPWATKGVLGYLSIECLGLNIRLEGRLIAHGITSVGQLLNKTRADLNFLRASDLETLEEKLRLHGASLRSDDQAS